MENNIAEKEIPEQSAPEVTASEAPQVYTEKPVGFWAFLGIIVLFAIPVVGFIACIVFMFAPERKSIKNYARAFMAWLVINFVSTIAVLMVAVSILGAVLLPTINNSLGTNFNNIYDILGVVTDVVGGNYADAIAQMRPELEEKFGEEIAPVLEEVSKPEYNEFFRQIVNEDYSALLSDFQEGQYSNLKNVLGEEIYGEFMTELQAAANGEYSEVFDELNNTLNNFNPF